MLVLRGAVASVDNAAHFHVGSLPPAGSVCSAAQLAGLDSARGQVPGEVFSGCFWCELDVRPVRESCYRSPVATASPLGPRRH